MSRRTCVSICLPLCLFTAACNDGSPAREAAEPVTSALEHSATGRLMAFGGGACVTVQDNRVGITPCQAQDSGLQTFGIDGDQIKASDGRCMDIQFGDLAAGVVGLTTCNGTVNQRWTFGGGRIISKNASAGQPYCLDGHFAMARVVGVAVCNASVDQAFWMAGYTLDVRSSFSVSTGPGTCDWECLDVAYDVEQAGTPLVNFNCNGTNAQWFSFDTQNRIRLANKQDLCIGLNGPIQGGLAPVALQTCNGTSEQRWRLTNSLTGTSIKSWLNNVCLDVQFGSATPGTPVVAFTCNGTAAQTWSPQLAVPACSP